MKFRSHILASLLLITLPLLETLGSGTLWSLNYHSPKAMDSIGDVLRLVKLISVIFGLYLLVKCREEVANLIRSKILRYGLLCIFYLISTAQIILLGLGNLFFGIMAPQDYIHYEQSTSQKTFYVYTADPGAFGQAYHHVYLKCSLPLNRYQLKKIGKVGWLGAFTIDVVKDDVVLSAINTKNQNSKTSRLNLKPVNCF